MFAQYTLLLCRYEITIISRSNHILFCITEFRVTLIPNYQHIYYQYKEMFRCLIKENDPKNLEGFLCESCIFD